MEPVPPSHDDLTPPPLSVDPRLLAASVARLHRDGDARAQLTAAGRARYRKHFDNTVLAQQLRKLIEAAP